MVAHDLSAYVRAYELHACVHSVTILSRTSQLDGWRRRTRPTMVCRRVATDNFCFCGAAASTSFIVKSLHVTVDFFTVAVFAFCLFRLFIMRFGSTLCEFSFLYKLDRIVE